MSQLHFRFAAFAQRVLRPEFAAMPFVVRMCAFDLANTRATILARRCVALAMMEHRALCRQFDATYAHDVDRHWLAVAAVAHIKFPQPDGTARVEALEVLKVMKAMTNDAGTLAKILNAADERDVMTKGSVSSVMSPACAARRNAIVSEFDAMYLEVLEHVPEAWRIACTADFLANYT